MVVVVVREHVVLLASSGGEGEDGAVSAPLCCHGVGEDEGGGRRTRTRASSVEGAEEDKDEMRNNTAHANCVRCVISHLVLILLSSLNR